MPPVPPVAIESRVDFCCASATCAEAIRATATLSTGVVFMCILRVEAEHRSWDGALPAIGRARPAGRRVSVSCRQIQGACIAGALLRPLSPRERWVLRFDVSAASMVWLLGGRGPAAHRVIALGHACARPRALMLAHHPDTPV